MRSDSKTSSWMYFAMKEKKNRNPSRFESNLNVHLLHSPIPMCLLMIFAHFVRRLFPIPPWFLNFIIGTPKKINNNKQMHTCRSCYMSNQPVCFVVPSQNAEIKRLLFSFFLFVFLFRGGILWVRKMDFCLVLRLLFFFLFRFLNLFSWCRWCRATPNKFEQLENENKTKQNEFSKYFFVRFFFWIEALPIIFVSSFFFFLLLCSHENYLSI